ncbi:MAG: hypothetical protein JXR58_13035 [Bacteroidales bacterium]|nr:hypothetical protein [Bacteroidales bacterium]
MEIALSIFYSAVFIFFIYRLNFFKISGVSRRWLAAIFLSKVIAGTLLMLIYTNYYKTRESADVFKYFDDSKIIFSAVYENPVDYARMVTGIQSNRPNLEKYYQTCDYWYKDHNYKLYNDNRTVIRFNAIVMLLSFGYFSVHTVFMAFLSFLGLFALFKVYYRHLQSKKTLLFVVLFFVPSVMLWTSGVLKEGLLMFGLGMLVYYLNKLSVGQFRISYIFLFLLMLSLLVITKVYVLIAALPGLAIFYWFNRWGTKRHLLKFLLFHLLIIIVAFNSKYIIPSYDLPYILAHKQHDFIGMVDGMQNVGSKIDLPVLEPTGLSILINSPNALFNSLVRPHPLEIDSMMMALASLENLFVLIFLIICLCFSNREKLLSGLNLFYFGISFALLLFIITGLTTPVLGAVVRYKAPAIPFLLMAFLLLLDINKLYRFVNKIIRPFNLKIKTNDK